MIVTILVATTLATGVATLLVVLGRTSTDGAETREGRAVARMREELTDLLDLDTARGTLGLQSIELDAGKVDFDSLFSNARSLVILMNDGRTWLSVHRDRLRQRLADPHKTTTIFLIDPMSPLIDVLARKGSTDPESVRAKIYESIDIVEECRGAASDVEVLGHCMFNPFSCVVSEDEAVVVPYFASRGGRTVPAFRYRQSGPLSYLAALQSDMEALRIDARDLRNEATAMGDNIRSMDDVRRVRQTP